eukprot:TRINITY_DN2489_c0_g1_i1.p1 TRINITY_DN2489_c0_g1~~TRINITY_DN2489_c0_g1_i1.p1  ORF type:complete len:240 (-),score=110.48 TRINITY_DN2489_c0_g1_i1:184-873(-)
MADAADHPTGAPASKDKKPREEDAEPAEAPAKKAKASEDAATKNPTVTFETTLGTFKAELFLDQMPLTVSNFVDLAKTGFYDGLHFHRVIPDFMAQFGCPYTRKPESMQNAGVGNPEEDSQFENLVTKETISRDEEGQIPDEFTAKISNTRGTLSMANCGPNTGGSQFFINVADNPDLDWWDKSSPSQHPVFGKVTDGMDIVVKITKVPSKDDRPKDPIKMVKVTVSGV